MVPPRVKPGSFPTSTSGAVVSSSVPSVFAASVVTSNMVAKGELELAMRTRPSINVYRNGKGTQNNGTYNNEYDVRNTSGYNSIMTPLTELAIKVATAKKKCTREIDLKQQKVGNHFLELINDPSFDIIISSWMQRPKKAAAALQLEWREARREWLTGVRRGRLTHDNGVG